MALCAENLRLRPTAPHPRVLLVDDQFDSTRMLSMLLRASGYSVEIANSVASALQLAAVHPFDILVTDIGLPDATGYELMKQIRELYGMKGIAVSGRDDDQQRSVQAGFAAHLTKPVNVEELETIMQRMLAEEDPLTGV